MSKRLEQAVESIAESFKSLANSLELMQKGQASALSRVPDSQPDPAKLFNDIMNGFGKVGLPKNIGNGGEQ